MKETLKSVKWMDGLILVMAIWILAGIRLDSMSTLDVIYLVTFSIWILLFLLRLFLIYRRVKRGES